MAQISSKTCDLSNKDLGYLQFDGLDLHHCKWLILVFLAHIYGEQI
jgi:hypothetical protein